jgi:transposase-like protein
MSTAVEMHVMTEGEANAVTEEIRHAAKSFVEYRARLMDAVDRAKAGNAQEALGYRSWTAYLSDVLGEEPMRLARAERQDMVRMLSDEGMSTRAIAPIVGANYATVSRDLQAGVASATPEPEANSAPDEAPEPPAAVTGLDGKTYAKPESKAQPKPRAEAITSQFTSAVVDLNRVLAKFRRIADSDNFNRNKNQVATLHGSDLDRAISELQNLADQLH